MSIYTSQEEKVILKDDDKITSIDLYDNLNLKVLIIDNLSNLKGISISVNKGLYFNVSNCVNLIGIETFNTDDYGNYFYLGENLNSLTSIMISQFKTVKFADEIFNKLDFICFDNIGKLICDFKNFVNDVYLDFSYVVTSNLIINSNVIRSFVIFDCSIENIEILGKCDIKNFRLGNNEYKSLKIENPIKTNSLTLRNDNADKVIPYIKLSDEIDKTLKFYISLDNIYDSQYKYFIERNSSKIEIYNYSSKEKLNLDDVKFDIPQKKRAR